MIGPRTEQALTALRADWGDTHVITYDDAPGTGGPGWRAWPLKIGAVLTAASPDELDAALRADRGARSTR